MRTSELQDLLISRLIRKSGGTQRRWRLAIGPIHLRDLATHAHCNWTISPSGGTREIAEIEKLLDDVRLEHPFVSAG